MNQLFSCIKQQAHKTVIYERKEAMCALDCASLLTECSFQLAVQPQKSKGNGMICWIYKRQASKSREVKAAQLETERLTQRRRLRKERTVEIYREMGWCLGEFWSVPARSKTTWESEKGPPQARGPKHAGSSHRLRRVYICSSQRQRHVLHWA